MQTNRLQRLGVLTALYAAQGLPYGFFTQALPSMLREMGVSLEIIGATAVLAAPWALKALWAPFVERRAALRTWALGLQAVTILGAVMLALLNPEHDLMILGAAVLLSNLVAATQDIATDGIAVATLAPEERGWGNGLQVAGYRIGMIAGGSLLLVIYDVTGWSLTAAAMALLLALTSLPLLLSDVGKDVQTAAPSALSWTWLQLPGALPWVGVLVTFKLGDYLVQGMLRPWLVDAGRSLTDIAVLLGVGGFSAGLVGAIVGGALVGPLGRRRALVLFGVLQALSLGSYALAAWTGSGIWAAVLSEHFLGGCATAAVFTAMMDACRSDRGATDYTLQASIVVIASMGSAGFSGVLAAHLGFAGVFTLGAILALGAPLLAMVIPTPRTHLQRERAWFDEVNGSKFSRTRS
ncbi:MAG: MFS transporter [Myxococcota bacterium]